LCFDNDATDGGVCVDMINHKCIIASANTITLMPKNGTLITKNRALCELIETEECLSLGPTIADFFLMFLILCAFAQRFIWALLSWDIVPVILPIDFTYYKLVKDKKVERVFEIIPKIEGLEVRPYSEKDFQLTATPKPAAGGAEGPNYTEMTQV